jgi:hypothetical protein
MQMSSDNHEEMTALFGPLAKYSDHKPGETIRFRLRGQEVVGEILWVTGPGETVQSRHTPITYVCGVEGEFIPALVYQSEVLEDK